jgi:hypothetical protein
VSRRLLCPNAPVDVKAILLGVVQPDGSVAFKDRILGGACKPWANEL